MKRTEMENKITELSEEQMNAGQGGDLFDIIRDSIGSVLGSVTEQIGQIFHVNDGCTGKQFMPGLNVY